MMTQSVGVPLTAKRRSSIARRRSGSFSDSECDTPDWSSSGAITHTSCDRAPAISAQMSSPSEWMPSSLVMRMRMFTLSLRDSNHFEIPHVWAQRIRHCNRPTLLLVRLHDRDQRPTQCHTRAVERVDVMQRTARFCPNPCIHPPCLERAA